VNKKLYSKYALEKDLKNLYLKTSVKSIENLFLKLAQENYNDFFNWLKKHKNDIKINDGRLIQVLLALNELRNKHPSAYNRGELISFLALPANAKYFEYSGYFKAFIDILNDPDIGKILTPFQDIILNSNVISDVSNPVPDQTSLLNDLKTIFSEYVKYGEADHSGETRKVLKKGKKQKKIDLFSYLLTNMSNDLADAALSLGSQHMHDQFKAGIILKPDALGELMDMRMPGHGTLDASKDILRYFYRNLEEDQHFDCHDYFKTKVMLYSGAIEEDDLLGRKLEFADPSQYLGHDIKMVKDKKSTITKEENKYLLTPESLVLICTVFVYFYNDIG